MVYVKWHCNVWLLYVAGEAEMAYKMPPTRITFCPFVISWTYLWCLQKKVQKLFQLEAT